MEDISSGGEFKTTKSTKAASLIAKRRPLSLHSTFPKAENVFSTVAPKTPKCKIYKDAANSCPVDVLANIPAGDNPDFPKGSVNTDDASSVSAQVRGCPGMKSLL